MVYTFWGTERVSKRERDRFEESGAAQGGRGVRHIDNRFPVGESTSCAI